MDRGDDQRRHRLVTSLAALVGLALALVIALAVQRSGPVVAGAWATASIPGLDASATVADRALLATSLELALLNLVNIDRVEHGLRPVVLDESLLELARLRASHQLGSQPLAHHDPSGDLVFMTLLTDAGIDFALAGENLARASALDGSTIHRVEQALMRSPTHRQNILEPTFTRLAIGTAIDASGQVAFAQIFLAERP